jgi:hypothetical protein
MLNQVRTGPAEVAFIREDGKYKFSKNFHFTKHNSGEKTKPNVIELFLR